MSPKKKIEILTLEDEIENVNIKSGMVVWKNTTDGYAKFISKFNRTQNLTSILNSGNREVLKFLDLPIDHVDLLEFQISAHACRKTNPMAIIAAADKNPDIVYQLSELSFTRLVKIIASVPGMYKKYVRSCPKVAAYVAIENNNHQEAHVIASISNDIWLQCEIFNIAEPLNSDVAISIYHQAYEDENAEYLLGPYHKA